MADADIRLVEASDSCAFDYTRGDTNTVIAIIDAFGVRLNHPDLIGNLLVRGDRDWCFDFSDTCDTCAIDLCLSPAAVGMHGTFCAGVAAATLDSVGVTGACPECSILPIRVQSTAGPAGEILADAIQYIREYADTLGARTIISMSFGKPTETSWEAFHSQLDLAFLEDDIVVVAGAGNNADSLPWYPGWWSSGLCVSATDRTDSLACYSGWGDSVDVAAPGGELVPPQYGEHQCIPPCEPGECDSIRTQDFGVYSTTFQPLDPTIYYEWAMGASFAGPLVAGVAGLIRSAHPEFSAESVRELIETTADTVNANSTPGSIYRYDPVTGKSPALGHGRVNAFRAVRTAVTSVPVAIAPALYSGPNPFRQGSGTWFTASVARPTHNMLSVYDVRGRRVRALSNGMLALGANRIWWDGRDDNGNTVPPGVYFASWRLGNERVSAKITIVP